MIQCNHLDYTADDLYDEYIYTRLDDLLATGIDPLDDLPEDEPIDWSYVDRQEFAASQLADDSLPF